MASEGKTPDSRKSEMLALFDRIESVLIELYVNSEIATLFFEKWAPEFEGGRIDGESRLSHTQAFNEYRELLETVLEGKLEEFGVERRAFVDHVRSALEDSADADGHLFANMVVSLDDFRTFKAMMIAKAESQASARRRRGK